MNKLFFFVAALFVCNMSMAQDEEPTRSTTMGGESTLSFANTGFGDLWSGGGLGSTTVGGILNGYLNNTYENGATWDNVLRIDEGVARIENANGDNFTKSSDVIDFVSKYGVPVKGSDVWSYSTAFNVLTQLYGTELYDDTGSVVDLVGLNGGSFGQNQSTLLAPGDISLGFGFDYKPSDNFSAFIGPLSAKLRVVGDDLIAQSGLYGNEVVTDDLGNILSFDNTRFEAGTSAIANFQDTFLTDDMLSFQSGLKLFSNYLEDPDNVDVNWNTVTSLNPWKFITLTYATDLAYDDNKAFTTFANGDLVGEGGASTKGVQWRNVFGIGLIHKFGDSKE